MSLAKKCDRCGNFYDENINIMIAFNWDKKDHYYANKSLDLCPSCKDSFEKWLNKKGD